MSFEDRDTTVFKSDSLSFAEKTLISLLFLQLVRACTCGTRIASVPRAKVQEPFTDSTCDSEKRYSGNAIKGIAINFLRTIFAIFSEYVDCL